MRKVQVEVRVLRKVVFKIRIDGLEDREFGPFVEPRRAEHEAADPLWVYRSKLTLGVGKKKTRVPALGEFNPVPKTVCGFVEEGEGVLCGRPTSTISGRPQVSNNPNV